MDDLQAIADGADGVIDGDALAKLLDESEQYMKILSLAGQSTGDAYTTVDNVRQLAQKLIIRIEHLETSSSSSTGTKILRDGEVVYQDGRTTPYVYTNGEYLLYHDATGVHGLVIGLPIAVCFNKKIYLWLRVRPSEGTSWKGTATIVSESGEVKAIVPATITNEKVGVRINEIWKSEFDIIQCTLGKDIETAGNICQINIFPFYYDMEEVDSEYYAQHKADLLTESSM